MIVDVHAHCIPESFRSWIAGNGDRVGVTVEDSAGGQCVQFRDGPRTGPQYSWPSLTDHVTRVEAMDRMGIDLQVLAGWIDLAGYELAPETALEYARAHNESLAAEAERDTKRFRAIGTAPLQDVGLAIAALEHAMDELGMVGLQLATKAADTYLGNLDLDDFWAAAVRKRAFLLLHPVRPLEKVQVGPHFLDNSVGRPAESTISLGGLIMSGVLERHPGLRLCVVHGGGFVPFQIGRLDRSYHQIPNIAAQKISRSPSSYLDQVLVDTIVHDPSALRFAIDRMGVSHTVMGTDYPFPMGDDDPAGTVEAVDGLTEGERSLILGGNAATALGLTGP